MKVERISMFVTAAIVLLCPYAAVRAQQPTKNDLKASASNTCAYSAINGNCTLILDRLNPVAPPTIYVRRGKQVTVIVSNPLPFEHLTIGEKSAASQVPPDVIANGFSAITTALGGLQVISESGLVKANEMSTIAAAELACTPKPETSLADIKACQVVYKQALEDGLNLNLEKDSNALPALNFGTWTYSRLCWVRSLFIPLSPGGITPANATPICNDLPDPYGVPAIPKSEADLTGWIAKFSPPSGTFYSPETKKLAFPSDTLGKNIDALDQFIAEAKQESWLDAADLFQVKTRQKALHAAFNTAKGFQTKMQGVLDTVNALPNTETDKFTISDLRAFDGSGRREKNNELDTWDLNADNELAKIATLVKADSYGDPILTMLGTLSDSPTRQTVVEFKVDFVNPTRIEISSGLLFPVRQYHSFSVATPYSSATATIGCTAGTSTAPLAPTNCPIVQQTLTLAVVPDVSFNIPFHEMVIGQQRAAWMFTIAPGYNSATTTATIGAGVSFAYKSLVFSVLPLADRDVKLTGGYQVNQSAGTATSPTTSNVWRVNPSFGISLRVPLGGGSN